MLRNDNIKITADHSCLCVPLNNFHQDEELLLSKINTQKWHVEAETVL